MNKTYTFLCALLGIEAFALADNKASLSDEQLAAIENHIADLSKKITERDATIADLKAKLDAKPADTTTTVVEDSKPTEAEDKIELSAFDDYVNKVNSAHALYNSI